MGHHLYIGETDYKRWGDKLSLSNATRAAAQGTVEQFSIKLQNYADVDTVAIPPTGGPLPPLPRGHVPILYIDVPDELNPAVYDILFSGVLMSVMGDDASMQGATTIHVATPMKPLKTRLHYVVFYPDREPTDTDRLRRLGVILEGQLPDWDFTTYVPLVGNITYPPYLPYVTDGTSGDQYDDYTEASVEEIIRSISTDPGWFTDLKYPAPARNWYVEGDFNIPGDPTSGVTFYFHYINVPDPTIDPIVDLVDAPTPMLPDGEVEIVYGRGATFTEDYSAVVRQIHIAGSSISSSGNSLDPTPVVWKDSDKAIGNLTPNTGFQTGQIFKKRGVDGEWDTGAVLDGTIWTSDWEITCQTQEVYLQHDTFQKDDNHSLLIGNTGQTWTQLSGVGYGQKTPGNPIGIKDRMAVPMKGPSQGGGLSGGMHIAVQECYATTCNLRWHLGRNRLGMMCIFRLLDQYNYWAVKVVPGGYDLIKMVGTVPEVMGHIETDQFDMQEIKVSLRNSDMPISVIEVYVDDVVGIQINDDTFWDYSFHGLAFDCDYDPSCETGAFYDFQCTTFWSDRAFGFGDNQHPHHWIDMSYAFLFNSDGTYRLTISADPVNNDEWLVPYNETPTEYGTYHYNDRFKILTAEFMDDDTRSLKRLVQWLKQPGGVGEWVMLYEVRPITGPEMTTEHPWYVQFAAKERGATLTNVLFGRSYSNLFVAPATYSELYGGNRMYPANGLLQSDHWDTYRKRQKVADAIWVAEAEPKIIFNAEAMTKVERGAFARIACRRAGWTNPPGGPDNRKLLMCTSVVRVETGNLRMPRYRMTFGAYLYASEDAGRTHLMKPNQNPKKPANRPTPTFDGMALRWYDEDIITGRESYGDVLEVQIIKYNELDLENQEWPTYTFNATVQAAVIPPDAIPVGGQFSVRHRTVGKAGKSDWSDPVPFVSPPQAPSERLSTATFYMGDGAEPIAANDLSVLVPINQHCKITGWALILEEFEGNVQLDVQFCTAYQRRTEGDAAFTSITAAGEKLFVQATPSMIHDGKYNEGYDITDWLAPAHNLYAGDWLRLKVLSAETEALYLCAVLMLQPLATPFTQIGQASGGQIGMAATVDDDGEALVDDDFQQLTDSYT